MGLLSGLLTFPLVPARGVVWAVDQALQEAEREYYDPVLIWQELDRIEELRHDGRIDPDEADRQEELMISRLMGE